MAEQPCRLHIKGGGITRLVIVPSSECTILEVKQQIEAELGIQVARQTLWSFEEDEKMEDSKKIGEYGICNYVIRLEVQPPSEDVTREIKVSSTDNAEHKFVVKETETVQELKMKVEGKLGAKAEEMKLYVQGYANEMKNDEPLYKYYIRDGTTITAMINKAGKTDSEMGSTST